MENKEYKYKLQLIDDEDIITSEFSAHITVEDLILKLRDFLCAAGWGEEKVKEMLNLE